MEVKSEISVGEQTQEQLLHKTCEEGDLTSVQHILSEGEVDINCKGDNGRTPFMTAALKGQRAVFEYLVQNGCDLFAVNSYDNTVLHSACIGGHLDIVKRVVDLGVVDKECGGYNKRTPVMIAADRGHLDVFNFLVSIGCSLTTLSKTNNNILHAACIGGNVEIVKYILDLNIVDKESRGQFTATPLLFAAMCGHVELFNFLISKGCNMTACTSSNNNILHLACLRGHLEMAKHIFSLQVIDKESRGQYQRTPLQSAVTMGHIEMFNFLLSKGCSMTAVTANGNNILHTAIINNRVELTQQILSLQVVDKESRGQFKRTPLLLSAAQGDTKVFDVLLNAGCDATVVTPSNNNVLHLACILGRLDMAKHIVSLNIVDKESKGQLERTPLLFVAEVGNIELFEFLVEMGCDPSVVDNDNDTVLHRAAFGGKLDMVKHVLSLDCVDKDCRGYNDRTPLMYVAEKGHIDVLDFLISIGCNITAMDKYNNTVLHNACIGGKVSMVAHLLSMSVVSEMAEMKNSTGRTPDMVAQSKGFSEVVTLFSENMNIVLSELVI